MTLDSMTKRPNDLAVGNVLRDLAALGHLADAVSDPAVSLELRGEAYGLAWPLVWARHTRHLESARGHLRCASSFTRLESGCLDGFHDDVEAVVDYLFRHARGPIHTVEGWITSRLRAAVVDGHRRRRGERGALQRVRVPKWLAVGLDNDPWLVELAGRVIEWVGVPHTAGLETWPIEAWTDLRAKISDDQAASSSRRVADDLQRVLTVMRRTRPAWFAAYIERPLGGKEPAVACSPDTDRWTARSAETALALDDDAMLADLARAAVDAIDAGLAAGRDPNELVLAVVKALFLERADLGPTRSPYSRDWDRWLGSVFADERAVATLVRRVLDVVQRTDCGA